MIGNTTITVARTTRDRYGDRAAASTHTIEGCAVVPSSSSESYGDRTDQVSTSLVAYAPQGADITAQDVVAVPGYPGQFQVVGDPLRYPVPRAWTFGTEINLTKVAG